MLPRIAKQGELEIRDLQFKTEIFDSTLPFELRSGEYKNNKKEIPLYILIHCLLLLLFLLQFSISRICWENTHSRALACSLFSIRPSFDF